MHRRLATHQLTHSTHNRNIKHSRTECGIQWTNELFLKLPSFLIERAEGNKNPNVRTINSFLYAQKIHQRRRCDSVLWTALMLCWCSSIWCGRFYLRLCAAPLAQHTLRVCSCIYIYIIFTRTCDWCDLPSSLTLSPSVCVYAQTECVYSIHLRTYDVLYIQYTNIFGVVSNVKVQQLLTSIRVAPCHGIRSYATYVRTYTCAFTLFHFFSSSAIWVCALLWRAHFRISVVMCLCTLRPFACVHCVYGTYAVYYGCRQRYWAPSCKQWPTDFDDSRLWTGPGQLVQYYIRIFQCIWKCHAIDAPQGCVICVCACEADNLKFSLIVIFFFYCIRITEWNGSFIRSV